MRVKREQFSVLCQGEGVVSQVTDNRFAMMTAWAALNCVLQRLLSMEKLISLPVLL